MATSFTADHYDVIREGSQRSARVVVPLILATIDVLSVVDVGCGEGIWAQAFADHGCDVHGVEVAGVPKIPHTIADLEDDPFPDIGSFDLAVCLEVGEHLTPDRAGSFVADLCDLAPVVAFSAAIPGQGGIGHLNEQWPAYWVELFEAKGYVVSDDLRWRIWADERVENWYRQNLLIASEAPLKGFTYGEIPSVVHPVLYDARRQP